MGWTVFSFFKNYFIETEGRLITFMQYSNIIIVVMGVLRDQNLYLEYIKNHNIPKRLSMILYLVDESHEYYKHFPVNYLRSWGISNVLTSHYIVLDMDIHFSGILTFSLSIIVNTLDEMYAIPRSVVEDDHAAVILPVFFLPRLIYKCKTLLNCTYLYRFLLS